MADSKFFLTEIDRLRDPIRNTRWRVLFPTELVSTIDQYTNENFSGYGNDMSLHVKSATIPKIDTKTQAHNYMGFESHYVVNTQMAGTASFDGILLEDMKAYHFAVAWNQMALNTGILHSRTNAPEAFVEENVNYSTVGDSITDIQLGLGFHKDEGAQTPVRNAAIQVQLFDFMHGVPLCTVVYYNAICNSVEVDPLAYSPDAKLMNFKFGIQYDRWSIKMYNTSSVHKTPFKQ